MKASLQISIYLKKINLFVVMIGADSKIIANVNNLVRNNKGGISLHLFFGL
jgi:hypothetical protein